MFTDDFDGDGDVDFAAGILQFQFVLSGVFSARFLYLQLAHLRLLWRAQVVIGR